MKFISPSDLATPASNETSLNDALAIEILTPEGVFLSATAHLVELPTTDGEIGVMAGHQRLAVNIDSGILTIHTSGGNSSYSVGEGFARITSQRVSVLASSACSEIEERDLETVFTSALAWIADVNDATRISAARRRAQNCQQEFHGSDSTN